MPLSNGETFAGFRIVRLLGSGGMGEVYLAEHPRLPRRDALKILPADVSADDEYRARFNREADLASTLYHPHIVSVHDRGEDEGQLWISMDYVDGFDAARLLTDRFPAGMPPDQVVRIVNAVASALDYAHKQGLLHRDVKPANIMVTHVDEDDEQRILLADFGIARNVDDISGLTTTNMTVGTVAYSAPEQLMGEEIDGRADQYALAATAYHLLTGSQLFPHSNPAVVISRHLNSPPPALADTRSELAALDPIMSVALAKDPNDRFQRCADFARALAEQSRAATMSDPTAATRPAPVTQKASRSRKRWAVIAAIIGVVVLAVAAVLVWWPWQEGSSTTTATASVTSPPVNTTTQPPATTSIAPPPLAPPTTSTADPAPAFRTALADCYQYNPIEVKPTNTGCRHHWYEDLKWSSWGPNAADGTGIQKLQNCTPSCAEGEMFSNPVELHFSAPGLPPPNSSCPIDIGYYTQLIVAYPSTSPPPLAALRSVIFSGEPVTTKYNGMPAYRWNALAPIC
jgi:serine/threonine-protein kinase